MSNGEVRTFSDVDRHADPSFFVSYLNTISSMEWAKAYKNQSFHLLRIQEGHRVLDVGCGAGDDVRAMAQLVGQTGLAVGVDFSETMITHARKQVEGQGLSVAYYRCDANQLMFADDFFDGTRSDRVFQHLEDPRAALSEMIRVTTPGGRIVITDIDWETLVIDVGDRCTTRKLANYICDSMRSGWIGRQLPRLFKQAGLKEIMLSPATFILSDFMLADQLLGLQRLVGLAREAGVVTADTASDWLTEAKRASQDGYFFAAATGFGVCGRKPQTC